MRYYEPFRDSLDLYVVDKTLTDEGEIALISLLAEFAPLIDDHPRKGWLIRFGQPYWLTGGRFLVFYQDDRIELCRVEIRENEATIYRIGGIKGNLETYL